MLPPVSRYKCYPEDEGRTYLQNVCHIAHNHTLQLPKNRININKRAVRFGNEERRNSAVARIHLGSR
jgi:hypothetical protein